MNNKLKTVLIFLTGFGSINLIAFPLFAIAAFAMKANTTVLHFNMLIFTSLVCLLSFFATFIVIALLMLRQQSDSEKMMSGFSAGEPDKKQATTVVCC